ncbi:GNAT family N-acetyltransferase [Citrobacter sp. Cs237]|uniref:GNAT family N-acetyltransferase n=1 Tax=Citrobacter TaxID=544 RepID=UPI002577BCBE|nr:GNAT family protein [Citrobacter sp. Cs237]MDM2751689.1 GNAT family N-acetyltransferase [Citrobacter sp. Cs237]HBU8851338.1 GNAT family N-acetyltransferase [Citrobacter sedlakii]
MTQRLNTFNQPVGVELTGWKGAIFPDERRLEGRYCRHERINTARHAAELYAAYREAPDWRDWTYLPSGPFETFDSYRAYLLNIEKKTDPMHYAVIDSTSGKAVGTVALMRIDAYNGVIEIGSVTYSRHMQRTRISTEVMALFLRHVFKDLGYRRFEWKCDSLNAPSRAAAERFGFRFEGIFRQALVYHGRNRDTAWYSVIDSEYPALRVAYEKWLAPTSFDENGCQREKLSQLINEARARDSV